MKRLSAVLCLLLSATAYSSFASNREDGAVSEAVDVLISPVEREPTFCRLGSAVPGAKWKVWKGTAKDFASDPISHFEIVENWPPSAHPHSIKIERADQFRIAHDAATDTLKLVHSRGGKRVATATLRVPSPGLWAAGRATRAGQTRPDGDYYVFLTPDRPLCRHATAKPGDACRTLHIEFYQDGDTVAAQHKPVLGTTVVNIDESQRCLSPGAQTEEGDGDHGLD
jgi:hypothetical protein